MDMNRFSLSTFPLQGKTIFLRVDYNVPLEKGKVKDNFRIKASLDTIRFLLQQRCKIVIGTHLGRPEGRTMPEYSTKPLAWELQRLLPNSRVTHLMDCIGDKVKKSILQGKPGQIFLLENLRFYPQEEDNNAIFAHSLAQLADVYVDDAFANAHRAHASMHAITHFLPSVAGMGLEREIQELSKALLPEHPLVWILGGAKLDKVNLLQQTLRKADYIIIGGALPFAFLRAKGIPVGMSKTDNASVERAKRLLSSGNSSKIILPVDFVVTETMAPRGKALVVPYNRIPSNQIALDIGPQTIELFKRYLRKANTIVWNGPLGYYEWSAFATGTKEIGRFLGKLTATSIAGGGETADAIRKFQLERYLTHVSTGGGASLEFLSGKRLPAIEALEENWRKWKGKNRKI